MTLSGNPARVYRTSGVGSKADIGARAALGWSVRQLGERADISFNTVSRFENGGDMLSANLDKVQRALEGEGVEFLNSAQPGIRWTE